MSVERSLIYHLPIQSVMTNDRTFVCSSTEEGERLLNTLEQTGLPKHMVEAGFASVRDFWAPWCAVMDGQTTAALAFAARLAVGGVEVGVYTFPGWRSRGLAAAVTAKWSSLPALAGRELFYSASSDNHSSQKVAERLKCRQSIGPGDRRCRTATGGSSYSWPGVPPQSLGSTSAMDCEKVH